MRSLGYVTDFFVAGFDGVVEPRPRYTVLRTPSNPDFWWGNVLLYPDAPTAANARRGHAESWLDDHEREFPGASVRLITWDRPDGAEGAAASFEAAGYAVDVSVVLTATTIRRPPKYDPAIQVAPFAGDADFEAARAPLTAAFLPARSGCEDDLRRFVDRQLERYRAMQAAGFGRWFGARVDGRLAGVLGLVEVPGERLGRFQLVGTDPAFGRRGVCSTLVHDVAAWALGERRLERLVMFADAHYHAARVYESVGFAPTERLAALLRKPPAT